VGKKKANEYPTACQKMALERLKTCRNASELAAESRDSPNPVPQPAARHIFAMFGEGRGARFRANLRPRCTAGAVAKRKFSLRPAS
jgi:hypothetical protein